MRYYCKNCGSEFVSGKGFNTKIKRPCFNPSCDTSEYMLVVPDFETPQQYEKRTGQPWPDNAPVWIGCGMDGSDYAADRLGNERWALMLYREVKDWVEFDIVCVQSPVPPPDGWRPE